MPTAQAISRKPRGDRRVLRIRLPGPTHSELARAASAADVSPEQLAAVWISEKVIQFAASHLRVAQQEAPSRDPRPANRVGSSARNVRKDNARRPHAAGGLHEEIAAVLAQRSEPMTVAEIAAEIRRRGKYRAPRTKRPISADMVSRRVSNPNYRSLFERSGRMLTLAPQEPLPTVPASSKE